ncbi:hypothetical protein NIES2100_65260 [Calothrix sp. NIES-2100]|uniref:hypothetical protein n=1 Tax=Calothrix sp. NIES-2100 TaxID=1954172 RepID=UPI000B5FA75E|nr:hypothetical protein NIES2100_65260 [Calothrix sp. NIES-2100]
MIRHISISAANPRHVAEVMAELWGGRILPFPSHAGSYMALAWDERGTMIEVYPLGTELVPGDAEVEFRENDSPSHFQAVHAAIDVTASEEQILAIAAREGWRVLSCNRGGFFEVIELWIENRLLLELLTPKIAPLYTKFMQPESLEAFCAAMGVA